MALPLTPPEPARRARGLRWLTWLWPRRLQQQLVAMVSLVLLLALGVLGGYTANEQSVIAQRSADEQATALASSVALASANLILTDSLDGLEELAKRSASFGELRRLQVCGLDGAVLTHVTREANAAPRLVFHAPGQGCQGLPVDERPHLKREADRVVVWQPVRAELLVGWVRLEFGVSALDSLHERIWRNTLVVTALAVTLCASLIIAFLERPMRALNRAREFAQQLADGSGRQMPLEPGPVEIEDMTLALNEASMLLRQQMILLEDNVRHLQAHEATLAAQNEQLGAIFALSPDGLVTFSRDEQVQFVNQAFLDLTGLQQAQVVGQHARELDALLQARARPGQVFAGLEACFAGDGGQVAPVVLEVAGDRRKVLSLSGQRSPSQSQTVARVLYVLDVTRQHTLDEMKSDFLSMAAHELRTPMVSIFGFTELMLKREMPPDQRQDLLGRIYRHSQSMVAILNELLDLARIEGRRGQDFVLEDLELAEQVLPVLSDYKPPEGRAAPKVQVADGPMPVRVDRHKLQQAVLNILSNAYKYSPDGGDIEVGFVREEGRVGVVVRDHGIGLSPDQLARMGERFFRADKSGNIPGTGLGVSIVKELMDLMGGRMQVDSELGRGTTVTLWF
jgi:two-component system, OmpR family, sensor histidine kinase VicK